jgi:hypothetical protein
MEDVLAVYTRPRDPERPLVCLDESSKQLIKKTRVPVPIQQGQPARVDYEYERNGTANLFMLFAPLEGWRHVKVTDRRTAIDFAHALKDLSDIHFPNAKQIVLVQDNLNTHKKASLYEAFPAPEARPRRAFRVELHAQTRQLARSGRVRARRSLLAMPRPPHPRQANPHRGSRRLGSTIAIAITAKPIGGSQPKMPVSNSSASTLCFNFRATRAF